VQDAYSMKRDWDAVDSKPSKFHHPHHPFKGGLENMGGWD